MIAYGSNFMLTAVSRGKPNISRWVMGLDQAIAVDDDVISWCEDGVLLLIPYARHEPQWHPPRSHLVCLAVVSPARKVVACVSVDKASTFWVEDAIEAGDERTRRYVSNQCIVNPCQYLAG